MKPRSSAAPASDGRGTRRREDDLAPVLVGRPRPEVALVTFNRPDSLNDMTGRFVNELSARLGEIAADPSARVVILTGAGRGFSSGHGLDDLGENLSEVIEGAPTIEKQLAHQRAYSDLILQINELPQPVIAAVNGAAAGGGLAMALAADTRVCGSSARFSAAFIRLGISGCDVGVSYLLPRIVGPTLAFEMMLTGGLVDADQAVRAGLVLRVVPDGEVVGAAIEIADRIIANSPFAARMTKRTMWANLDAPSLRHAIEIEDRTQVLCLQTGDLHEALPAVREKRTLKWPTA